MAPEKVMSLASSRPFRITALLLCFLVIFYLANPFAKSALASSGTPSDANTLWFDWKATTQKNAQVQGRHNASAHNEQEGGPRIRQASMIYSSNQYNAVYERAVASHIRHGDRWGVPTHILRHDIVEAGFFNKPAYLLGLIIEELSKPYGQRADWIVWFDADSILLNPEVPWNIFLPPPEYSHINFLGTKDQNGFNAGMMFLRVDKWTVNMLAQVITIKDHHPDVSLEYADQSALVWALERQGYQEHVIYQPHNWWNSFGLQGKPFANDRFVLHFAGVGCCGGEDKLPTMVRWLDLIESEMDHFVKPLSELTLQSEISTFWEVAISAKESLEWAKEWAKDSKYNTKAFQEARKELRHTVWAQADDEDKMKEGMSKLNGLRESVDKKGA